MNQAELIETIADLEDISKASAQDIISSVFESITEALEDGQDVQIRDFGKFVVSDRKARKGRNPATGESIDIAASKAVSFKVGSKLKALIKATA